MPFSPLANSTVLQALPLALDAASQRHQVIAANIAHADQPDWRAQKLTFEDSLQRALDAAGNSRFDAQAVQMRLAEDKDPAGVDAQIVQLSRNVLHYQALVKSTSAQLELLSLALNEGRR